eukprot:gnl/TRDRNA2_/TRDRNA2_146903_c0_seq1.p1 gnl/TRDRNA2_/TRDRNA2_146903_c0~~gnl/TRDRNA2_/TRDRNA2_146903_c0_seq1.p1  ORF type:complete len:637 (+),score=126.13 gnl/TRDRNA2_/TRDRNA2_146903_c0_seq1:59-1969(+)
MTNAMEIHDADEPDDQVHEFDRDPTDAAKKGKQAAEAIATAPASKEGAAVTYGAPTAAAGPDQHRVFADADAMKAKVRQAICSPKYNVFDYYHTEGVWQYIARRRWFEYSTLTVISVNALWIAIDTDHNKSESLMGADIGFQLAEHFFCLFFFLEWLVRFMAFKRKIYGFRDNWFQFDSVLVFFMVLETWVMTLVFIITGFDSGSSMGDAAVLRMLRLLRLTRMARITRLLRAAPELMILIKAMVAATRSVFFTLCLLMLIIYVFAIAFTQLTRSSEAGKMYFNTVADSMLTLTVYGTLLDEISRVAPDVGRENMFVGAVFFFFILLAALTVMNMLIGVLCEVVVVTASVEKEQLTVSYVNSRLRDMLAEQGLENHEQDTISKHAFEQILENPEAARALQEVGVDVVGLVDFTDFIFRKQAQGPTDGEEDDEEGYTELSFEAFMDMILQLRGSNGATVKDIVDLRKTIIQQLGKMEQRVENGYKKHALRQQAELEKSRPNSRLGPTDRPSTFVQSDRPLGMQQERPLAPKPLAPKPLAAKEQAGSRAVKLAPLAGAPSMPGVVETEQGAPLSSHTPTQGERAQQRQRLLMLEEALSAGMSELQVLRARSGRLEEALKSGLAELRQALFEEDPASSM